MSQSNVFGRRIRQRLKEMRQTQRWLAKQTGIPEQTISNIVNGRFENSGNITMAVPIAKALGTSVDYLFGVATRAEKPIYPSAKVRRLATMAEMLPDTELDQLLVEARRRMQQSRKELWQEDLVRAIEALVQQHGGDVESVLRQLDKLTGTTTGGDEPPATDPSPAPSLFDEWKQ